VSILLSLAQTMSVFTVFFFLYCRLPLLPKLRTLSGGSVGPWGKVSLFVFCTCIAIIGNYMGIRLEGGAIANTRAIGAVLAGFLGGPALGAMVGITAGAQRVSMGGFTALAGAIATTFEGLMAGGVARWRSRSGEPPGMRDWLIAAGLTAVGEVIHMGFVLAFSRPFDAAVEVVKIIGPPMIIANSFGVLLFTLVVRDRDRMLDDVAASSSAQALRIAQRALGLFAKGVSGEAARELAPIVLEETQVGAVAITDRDTILSFVGIGSDHHLTGSDICSPMTRMAIKKGGVVFADGVRESYICPVSDNCPLGSVLVAPLQVDGQVIGTVQLYEPRSRRFRTLNKSLGEGIAALLSSQIVVARYQEQKTLLTMAELKLMQAQVNPHFLFNSLNTIAAITRTDTAKARDLLTHLSQFFRKNLKRNAELSTLQEELDHVGAYLEIEKARFQERLKVETQIDPQMLPIHMPTFTLQPLIENAVKHGLFTTLSGGTARIRAYRAGGMSLIDIEDDAGAYQARDGGDGLGMKIVDERIKRMAGEGYGLSVFCEPQKLTRVTVRLPSEGVRR
jgi:two-component system, LytTR family, sensor kinase